MTEPRLMTRDEYPELPKWPLLTVLGNKISEDQAAEVCFRTNSQWWHTNDRQWFKEVMNLLGLPDEALSDYGSINDYQLMRKTFEKYGFLDKLYYLGNDRIMSSYVGGPSGWCDWQGNIFQADKNIGKWPTVEAVTEEWQLIAETFPYLELVAQAHNHEAGCEEYADGQPRPLVEWHVKDGNVTVYHPFTNMVRLQRDFQSDIVRLRTPGRERGCTLDKLQQAIDIVLSDSDDADPFDDICFTEDEQAAWNELEAFTKGEIWAPSYEDAVKAHRELGQWLERIEKHKEVLNG